MLEAFPGKPKGVGGPMTDSAAPRSRPGTDQDAHRTVQHILTVGTIPSPPVSIRTKAALRLRSGVTPKSNSGRNNHMDAITFSPTLATARMLLELAERHASTREPQT